ncbi:conserved hypothetical protein [Uncinocarpus reesii 1704]|uniref:Transcription initiation factor TFIID subunit 10 n=1 Tax=Uncinocarpus reesii (strain UAMH 1704) TaxID=336963 RepID=C4JRW0_UNCRE|nr:uncharacterized protein UREG_05199 [Uncinocarpus reesii 1704]EEP80357.1 conserved hypothetical protein [Uncinocarpus reesii 1704]
MTESQSPALSGHQADVAQPPSQPDSQGQTQTTPASSQTPPGPDISTNNPQPADSQQDPAPEAPESATPAAGTAGSTPHPGGNDEDMTAKANGSTSQQQQQDVVMGGTDNETGAGASGGGGANAAANGVNAGANAKLEANGLGGNMLNGIDPIAPPTKKHTSLREFLGQMDDYAPIIPDAVTAHYLTTAGLPPPGNGPNQTPPHLARLLALATQKFIADIAADAYQYSRIRASNSSTSNNPMGAINVTAGLNVAAGQGGNVAGGSGQGAAGGGEQQGKGKSGAAGLHLGVQRAGFGGGGQGGGQGKTVLTMEDLGMAVGEYGVTVKRGEFYR